MAALARRPGLGLSRCTVGRTLEAGITQPMEATSRHQQLLAITHQIADQFTGLVLVNYCSDRHFDHEVVTGLAGPVAPRTVGPAFGQELSGMTKIHQRVHATVGFQEHTAAISAVTPVGTAKRNVLLAPETDTAIATVAGTNLDCRFVDEFHGCMSSRKKSFTAKAQRTQGKIIPEKTM